jgi:hypothetical protein
MAINAMIVLQVIEQTEELLASHVDLVRMIITIPLLLVSYGLYRRIFEKRQAHEISLPGAGRERVVGFLVATTLVVLFAAMKAGNIVKPKWKRMTET